MDYQALQDELTEINRIAVTLWGKDFQYNDDYWRTPEYKKLERRADKVLEKLKLTETYKKRYKE